MPTLGVMLRAHRRHKSLDIVLRELLRYRTLGLDPKIHILLDRPSFEVEQVLDKYRDNLWGLKYLDFPILSPDGGERFREAKRFQYSLLEAARPDWVLLQDDDRIFEGQIDEELPKALSRQDIDLWYAQSLFLWDDMETVNVARHHNSPVLFRFRPGQSFPLDRDIQAPLPLHDDAIVQGRAGLLATPLLDVGTFSEDERREVYTAFLAAGKADTYVESIEAPPKLVPLESILKRLAKNPFSDVA